MTCSIGRPPEVSSTFEDLSPLASSIDDAFTGRHDLTCVAAADGSSLGLPRRAWIELTPLSDGECFFCNRDADCSAHEDFEGVCDASTFERFLCPATCQDSMQVRYPFAVVLSYGDRVVLDDQVEIIMTDVDRSWWDSVFLPEQCGGAELAFFSFAINGDRALPNLTISNYVMFEGDDGSSDITGLVPGYHGRLAFSCELSS